MRPSALLVSLIVCATSAGCETFFGDAFRNLAEAPVRGRDDVRLQRDTRRAARAAWDQYCRAHGGQHISGDFGEGFKAGFADYLYEGGGGQPPAVPPFPYQLRRYQTPQGHAAIEEWYAGFAAGSAAAQESGLRDNIVIPLSAPPVDAVPRDAGPPPAPSAPEPLGPPGGMLPPPRVVPDRGVPGHPGPG